MSPLTPGTDRHTDAAAQGRDRLLRNYVASRVGQIPVAVGELLDENERLSRLLLDVDKTEELMRLATENSEVREGCRVTQDARSAATTEPAAVHAARSHRDKHSIELVEGWDRLLAEVERLRTEKAGSDAEARRAWETVRRSADRQVRDALG